MENKMIENKYADMIKTFEEKLVNIPAHNSDILIKKTDEAQTTKGVEVEFEDIFGYSEQELLQNGITTEVLKNLLKEYFRQFGLSLEEIKYAETINIFLKFPYPIVFMNEPESSAAILELSNSFSFGDISSDYQIFTYGSRKIKNERKFSKLASFQKSIRNLKF
jgi:hypothetical protein